MTIHPDVHAEIRRLFHAEHWRLGTIAQELGVHRDTVRHALDVDAFLAPLRRRVATTTLDPFKPFVQEVLEKHPRLRASRIFEMVRLRGYPGSATSVRRYVRTVRPARTREAFFRLETLPGEQAQVDWGHFGKIKVGHAQRALSCFVMVLGYSRAIYARFSLDQSMESFLMGHVAAFEAFGGVPRTILYDNLKSAVLERSGQHVRFHPRLLACAAHYHFAPKPCAPFRPNEKGKVERTIQYLRSSFFAGRDVERPSQLNIELTSWVTSVADQRIWPGDPARQERVGDVFAARERPALMPRPEHELDCTRRIDVRSGKTPYVRFDLNDYSVPSSLVGMPVTLLADEQRVRVLHGLDLVATHARSWSRGERVEERAHFQSMADDKARARELRGRDRLRASCPSAEDVLAQLVHRDEVMRTQTAQLNRLLERYGPEALERALRAALERGTPTASSVAHLLDQATRRSRRPPPLSPMATPAPDQPGHHAGRHDLAAYDGLLGNDEDDTR